MKEYKADCLAYMDEAFFKDVNKCIKDKWSSIVEGLKGQDHIIYSMDIGIDRKTCIELYAKHFPTLDISDLGLHFEITINANNTSKNDVTALYTYKGKNINILDYYVRPKDYIEIPVVLIIEEVVLRGTHNPDMMKNNIQEKLRELAKEKLSE